jgi:glycosyltransferase involved in cell wall biosynthesis
MPDDQLYLLSVCLITYNHELYIREAIDGVLMQKCNFQIELVIGEDHGNDKTREICEEYAKQNTNIKLLADQKNLGAMANYIRTLEACTGNYIAILEGDDYWTDPYKLQKQLDYFESNPKCGYIHTDFDYLNVRDNTIIKHYYASNNTYIPTGSVLKESINNTQVRSLTVCVRKEIIQKLIPLLKIAEKKRFFTGDMILILVAAYYSEIGYLPDSTGVYRRQIETISSSDNPENRFKFFTSIIGSKLLCFDYLGLNRQEYKTGFSDVRTLLFLSLYLRKRYSLRKTYLFMRELGIAKTKDRIYLTIEKNNFLFIAFYLYHRISNKCFRLFSRS